MRVRIEGSGHMVEIECGDTKIGVEALANMVDRVWERTRKTEPRQPIGYAAQHLERTHDRSVAGAGDYQRQPTPVTA